MAPTSPAVKNPAPRVPPALELSVNPWSQWEADLFQNQHRVLPQLTKCFPLLPKIKNKVITIMRHLQTQYELQKEKKPVMHANGISLFKRAGPWHFLCWTQALPGAAGQPSSSAQCHRGAPGCWERAAVPRGARCPHCPHRPEDGEPADLLGQGWARAGAAQLSKPNPSFPPCCRTQRLLHNTLQHKPEGCRLCLRDAGLRGSANGLMLYTLTFLK